MNEIRNLKLKKKKKIVKTSILFLSPFAVLNLGVKKGATWRPLVEVKPRPHHNEAIKISF